MEPQNDRLTCRSCGIEATEEKRSEADEERPCPVYGDGLHDWTATPLGRLLGCVQGENGSGEGVEVRGARRERHGEYVTLVAETRGDTEAAANIARYHGFAFAGLGKGDLAMRFRRRNY